MGSLGCSMNGKCGVAKADRARLCVLWHYDDPDGGREKRHLASWQNDATRRQRFPQPPFLLIPSLRHHLASRWQTRLDGAVSSHRS